MGAPATYFYASPATGATVTPTDCTNVVSLTPAGTLLTLTVNFPQRPSDGNGHQFSISSTQTLTSLSLVDLMGRTIQGLISTLIGGGRSQWVYDSNQNVWRPA